MKFFSDGSIPGKGTAEDFAREGRSSNVIQALDFRLVRDVIDQYLVAENGLRTVDSSLPVDQILGAAVVALADAFESFIDVLSVGSREKMLLENGTRVALGKLKKLKDFKE